MSSESQKGVDEEAENCEDGDQRRNHMFVSLQGTHTTSTCTDDISRCNLGTPQKKSNGNGILSVGEDIKECRIEENPCCSDFSPEAGTVVCPAHLNQFIDLFDNFTKTLATTPKPVVPYQASDACMDTKQELPSVNSDGKLHTIIEIPSGIPIPQKATATVAIQCSHDVFPVPPRVTLISPTPSLTDIHESSNVNDNDLASLCHTSNRVPCERNYNTLHIEVGSSPTSSVMYRPPLHHRLWSVLTDVFSAVCVCLQVNRDCIFCVGFFVAFVVSASFLTAFFYRTLSSDAHAYQPPPAQHQQPRVDFAAFGNAMKGK